MTRRLASAFLYIFKISTADSRFNKSSAGYKQAMNTDIPESHFKKISQGQNSKMMMSIVKIGIKTNQFSKSAHKISMASIKKNTPMIQEYKSVFISILNRTQITILITSPETIIHEIKTTLKFKCDGFTKTLRQNNRWLVHYNNILISITQLKVKFCQLSF